MILTSLLGRGMIGFFFGFQLDVFVAHRASGLDWSGDLFGAN
jgi:hypothetical protein